MDPSGTPMSKGKPIGKSELEKMKKHLGNWEVQGLILPNVGRKDLKMRELESTTTWVNVGIVRKPWSHGGRSQWQTFEKQTDSGW